MTKLLVEPTSLLGASAGPAACPSEMWSSAAGSVALAEGHGEGADVLKCCAFAPVEFSSCSLKSSFASNICTQGAFQ